MKQKTKKAFSLIELLIVIALIMIVTFWFSNLTFKNQKNKEELEKRINLIINKIDEIKFNSLLWKSEKNYIVADKQKIVINTWADNSLIIETWYLSWNTWNKIGKNILKRKWFFTKNFFCSSLYDKTATWSFYWSWEIIFEWKNIYLSWWDCSNLKYQQLEINFKLWNFEKNLIFNTISWNIEKK
jgi:prepilin-type N-terminal cleavage/methylation domain-containing protein